MHAFMDINTESKLIPIGLTFHNSAWSPQHDQDLDFSTIDDPLGIAKVSTKIHTCKSVVLDFDVLRVVCLCVMVCDLLDIIKVTTS